MVLAGQLGVMKICSTQPRRLSVPFVADHRRARANGGEKGKVEDGRDLLWWGRFDDQRARNLEEAEGHACSLMHRYRAVTVDTVVRTCRLSGQLQEKSFSSKNLSFETSEHDLEDTWSDSIEHCRKQTKFSHWGFRPSRNRYESGTASESAKRAEVFAGLYSSVHSSEFPSVASGYWWLPRNILRLSPSSPFAAKYAAAVTTASVQNEVYLFVVLVTAHAWRLVDWLISNFQPPIKAAPQQCPQKAYFKFHGFVQQRAKTFFGGTLGETFEAFAIDSDQRLSRLKELPERLLKICNMQQSAGQFVCGGRCNLQHVAWRLTETEFEFHAIPRKLRDRAIWK